MKGPGGTALLVVDVQRAALDFEPWRGAEVLEEIAALQAAARRAGVEVIHVQHDGEAGAANEPGTPGWEIHPAVAAEPGEKVIRKRFNSAFRGTELQELLEERGVTTLFLAGIQTEYCVDTTCRVAFELGYAVVLPEGAHTTYDLGELTGRQIQEHWTRQIFSGRFAEVVSLEEALARLGK